MVTEPLCGQKWFEKHQDDHTDAEMSALSIEIHCSDRQPVTIHNHTKKGLVKAFVKSQKGKVGNRWLKQQ